ncbi:MAG TPA: hypothetical protein VK864_20595 [Longimicrobiales bacterium]|nr:hypothetical protein [Longimicrobiales bacterium]
MFRKLIYAGLALIATACVEPSAPLPLDITITSDKSTIVAGDSVRFEIHSQGTALISLEVIYGDGDSYEADLADVRTADASLRHIFETTGTFNVVAMVTQRNGDAKQASMQILVQ